MRLTIAPEGLLERVALRLGLAPKPVIETMGGLLLARSLMAGVRLGVFEEIEKSGPRTPAELAAALGCSTDGVRVLLAALASSGYLTARDGRYANAPAARRWLLKSSPASAVAYMDFMYDQWAWLNRIEQIIATGQGVDIHAAGQDPAFWDRYMGALAELARGSADELARAIRLRRPPRRMLDVAGGHGLQSAALCRRYPDLASEILDLDDAARAGAPIVAAAGLASRIRYRIGDLRSADWGSEFDLVLLCNICHHLSEDENRAALAHARAALRAGGSVAVWDFQATADERRTSQVGGLMGVFFLATSGRRAHPVESIRAWIREAGFRGVRTRVLPRAPFGYLVTAEVS